MSTEPLGWTNTDTPEIQAKRLRDRVIAGQHRKIPASLEKMQFTDAPASDDDFYNFTEKHEPGSFVEVRRNGVASPGVILTSIIENNQLKYVVLIPTGEIWDATVDTIYFHVPGFVPADLAARCGAETVAETLGDLNARVEVLKRLREFRKSIRETVLELGISGGDIYSKVKHPHPDKWSTTTTQDVARMWKRRPTLLDVYAVHDYLMSHNLHFVVTTGYLLSQTFDVRPKSSVDRIVKITEWTRRKHHAIESFISKTQRMLGPNTKLLKQSFSTAERPRWSPTSDHVWTGEDKEIIAFLLETLRPYEGVQDDPFTKGESSLLRRILPDQEELTDAVTHNFLINIGVLPPWQQLVTQRPEMRNIFDPDLRKQNAEAVEKSLSLRSKPPPPGPLGPYDLHRVDPLDAIRHDFGDMPVYVVDDATAKELDDGLSLEGIPSEPGRYWVHVHIADPCSLIPPSHALAKAAELQAETIYLSDMTIPLFSPIITHDPKIGLSLNETGLTHRTLTFSCKVDLEGNIYEHKVVGGIIKNVQRITYDALEASLGLPPVVRLYPFGDKPIPLGLGPVPQPAIDTFRIFHKISQGLVAQRLALGAYSQASEKALVLCSETPHDVASSPSMNPGLFLGFPEMSYVVETPALIDTGARNIVAEMMKLSGRVASRFAAEHNLAVARRTSTPPLLHLDSDLQDLMKLRSNSGYIPWEEAVKYSAYEAAVEYSLETKGHFALGVPDGEGYVRISSPLRRYADMVSHWQIYSALLKQPQVFSKDWMSDYILRLRNSDRLRNRLQGSYMNNLAVLYLQRWMEDPVRREGRPNPLAELEGVITKPLAPPRGTALYSTVVTLKGLGMKAALKLEHENYEVGQCLPLKITGIKLGVKPTPELAIRE
ncbi:hypothetical protein C8J56DRAFT_778894 [Mycena floridula]|nr:hypothetical protein C8J56DRAFT_778894 [Mycena floridula]